MLQNRHALVRLRKISSTRTRPDCWFREAQDLMFLSAEGRRAREVLGCWRFEVQFSFSHLCGTSNRGDHMLTGGLENQSRHSASAVCCAHDITGVSAVHRLRPQQGWAQQPFHQKKPYRSKIPGRTRTLVTGVGEQEAACFISTKTVPQLQKRSPNCFSDLCCYCILLMRMILIWSG